MLNLLHMFIYIRCSLSSPYWKKNFLEPSVHLQSVLFALVLKVCHPGIFLHHYPGDFLRCPLLDPVLYIPVSSLLIYSSILVELIAW